MSDLYSKKLVGKRIREYRRQHHYTQFQFAEKINISVNFLSEIENGRKGMSQDTLANMCVACDLSADYLLFGKKPEQQPIRTSSTSFVDELNAMSSEELLSIRTYIDSLLDVRKIPRPLLKMKGYKN